MGLTVVGLGLLAFSIVFLILGYFASGSTVIPLVVIGIAIMVSYKFGGFFGIALSAIGMLATTGMVVAVDAYGPIADNSIWPNDPHSSQMVSLAILIGGILE